MSTFRIIIVLLTVAATLAVWAACGPSEQPEAATGAEGISGAPSSGAATEEPTAATSPMPPAFAGEATAAVGLPTEEPTRAASVGEATAAAVLPTEEPTPGTFVGEATPAASSSALYEATPAVLPTEEPTPAAATGGEPTPPLPTAARREVAVATGTSVGDKAPSFAMALADGTPVTSEGLAEAGRPVFMHYFATW